MNYKIIKNDRVYVRPDYHTVLGFYTTIDTLGYLHALRSHASYGAWELVQYGNKYIVPSDCVEIHNDFTNVCVGDVVQITEDIAEEVIYKDDSVFTTKNYKFLCDQGTSVDGSNDRAIRILDNDKHDVCPNCNGTGKVKRGK